MRRELLPVAAISVLGFWIRAASPFATDFPLNDGGLFYQMILDLERTWPALPMTTSYNGLDAPFAYPPLGFYLGAALHAWMGMDVMRVVPVVASALTVPAFYLLARTWFGAGAIAIAGTTAFALVPRSFEWMTMGGGLTRAPGFLLAIIATWLTLMLLRTPRLSWALGAGIAGGMVILTHPQAALFTLITGVLMVGMRARDRQTFKQVFVALSVAILVAVPWILSMASSNGLDPLLSASGTQPGPFIGLLSLLSFEVSGSRLFDVVGLLAAVGLLLSVLRGRWLLPAWLAATMVLDARGGATYASIPACLLAGQAFVDVVLVPFWRTDPGRLPRLPTAFARRFPAVAAVAVAMFAVGVIDAIGSQAAPTWPAVALSSEQREGIREAGRIAPGAEYLVVTGRFWAIDSVAEWFPVLSGAHSVGTVQGHEWLGSGFEQRLEASEALRRCANAGGSCLADWSEQWDINFSHIFIPKGSLQGPLGDNDCCTGLRQLLAFDPEYRLIYDRDGATIYEKLDG